MAIMAESQLWTNWRCEPYIVVPRFQFLKRVSCYYYYLVITCCNFYVNWMCSCSVLSGKKRSLWGVVIVSLSSALHSCVCVVKLVYGGDRSTNSRVLIRLFPTKRPNPNQNLEMNTTTFRVPLFCPLNKKTSLTFDWNHVYQQVALL